ncbi:hypothetical protein [Microtetraspora malaysiensis]|uniref:hypothetical protein n=1 Tax=Microtetraspora malaysiensis TaxID=161358 RepID=UPI0012F89D76|nr:hypothetical protein [Microtetraspora malaysiensis]
MADVVVIVVDAGTADVVATVAAGAALTGCAGSVTGTTRAEAAIAPAAKACLIMSDHPVS